jgi:hypothetical protein
MNLKNDKPPLFFPPLGAGKMVEALARRFLAVLPDARDAAVLSQWAAQRRPLERDGYGRVLAESADGPSAPRSSG